MLSLRHMSVPVCVLVDGEGASFDGMSRITYDISGPNQYVQTRRDLFKLRFRTNHADGLLFFADSNQGDYVVLELVHGKLYFHIDLGSTATQAGDTTMKAGSLLDDNQWHDVEIVRDGREINFTVDRLTITNMTHGEFFQLDLDRYVSAERSTSTVGLWKVHCELGQKEGSSPVDMFIATRRGTIHRLQPSRLSVKVVSRDVPFDVMLT